MPSLFDNLDVVQKFLPLSPLGLMTDIDGTIGFINPDPAKARVSPVCLHYLSLLSKRLKPIAVISGRPVVQMRDMTGIEDLVYIGNHGFERWVNGEVRLCHGAEQYATLIATTLRDLKAQLDIEGVIPENKGATASIHFRLSRNHEVARRQILAALTNYHRAKELWIRQGRVAIELFPRAEINKGVAVGDLLREYKLRSAIYLGDDLTDVDAFQAIHNARSSAFQGLCIGVIDEETAPVVEEEADFTLNGVSEVERFLKWLTGVFKANEG